jgi:hypothetical protein
MNNLTIYNGTGTMIMHGTYYLGAVGSLNQFNLTFITCKFNYTVSGLNDIGGYVGIV